jgi:hypothetical protein
MHTTIHNSTRGCGHPSAASTAPVSANGSAKTECSHLIISSVSRVLAQRFATLPSYPATQALSLWVFAGPLISTPFFPKEKWRPQVHG